MVLAENIFSSSFSLFDQKQIHTFNHPTWFSEFSKSMEYASSS